MPQVTLPYQEWLSIRLSEDEMPTAYALLGLKTFENDAVKIRAAAERQRMRLERHKPHADRHQWQQVQAELERAIQTLLEPSRRAELDLHIRRQSLGGERASAPLPPEDARGELTCPGCAQENSASKRFCSGCGDPLWIECLSCTAVMPAGEKFCGGCGESQEAVAQRMRDKNQQVIDQAVALGQQHRFPEAVTVLSPLIQLSHRHLREQVERAAELMDRFLAERSRCESQAAEALQEAQRLAEEADYVRAARLLREVPEPFRNDAIRRLLVEVAHKSEEVRTLKEELAEAIKNKRIDEATHRVERLLALNPDDQEADRIGRSLAQSLQQAAARYLAKGQYATSLKLLKLIPQRYRDEKLERHTEQVAELSWLSTDLRQSRFADSTLVEVAQRLTRAVPGDEQAARLKNQLEERIKKYQARGNGQAASPIPWAAAGGHSFLGVSIDWLTDARRCLIPGEPARATWQEHPGRFFVAAGLALRGLGRAALELDLKPRKKAGVLGNLPLTRARRTQAKAAWGIDLGMSSLKAVRLVKGDDERLIIDQCIYLSTHRQAALREGETATTGILSRVLKKFHEAHSIDAAEPVTVSVPNLKLLGRFLRIPRSEKKQFQQLLEYEIRHRIPFPLDDLCWDHHVVPDEAVYEEVPQSVLVLAAKQFEVRRWLAYFEEVELKVDYVQTDALALHNWLRFDRGETEAADAEDAHTAVAVLDVGSDASQVVVSWPGSLWFRTLATGGDDVTRALVKSFRLTHEQAEQLKHRPTRAKRLNPVYAAIEPVNTRLRTQLKQSVDAFFQDFPELRIRQAYAVGGGFGLHGLMTDLYREG